MHNGSFYPMGDAAALRRVDCPLAVPPRYSGSDYLRLLRERLPPFLDSVGRSATVELAIYNAGTDALVGDELGDLALSMDDVLARDRFVLQTLRERGFPTVVLTSGGYTQLSYLAIARVVLAAVEEGR